MSKKLKKITQKEAHMLMAELADFIIAARCWKLNESYLVARDADTGKVLPEHNPVDRAANLLIGIRTRIGQIKP